MVTIITHIILITIDDAKRFDLDLNLHGVGYPCAQFVN
jgi:hypothetical protein